MKKNELSALLYEFLEVIYLFQKREEGLFGASWQEIYFLKKLHDAKAMSIGRVAEAMCLPLFGASRMVARLQTKGWVRKTREKDNKRIIHVCITGAGGKILTAVEHYQFKLISKNMAVLTPREVESMSSGLVKLRKLLEIQ